MYLSKLRNVFVQIELSYQTGSPGPFCPPCRAQLGGEKVPPAALISH